MSNIPTGDFHGNLLRYEDWLAAWRASRIGFFASLVQGHRRMGRNGGGAFRCSLIWGGVVVCWGIQVGGLLVVDSGALGRCDTWGRLPEVGMFWGGGFFHPLCVGQVASR